MEIFAEFYEQQNGLPMTDEQEKIVRRLIEEIFGGNLDETFEA
jgi:hypothetical protein